MYCISVVLVILILFREHHAYLVTDITDITHSESLAIHLIKNR